MSTSLLTPSMMENNIQNQQNIELEGDQKIVEDNPNNQNLLADYKLVIDREIRQHMETKRMSYTIYQ